MIKYIIGILTVSLLLISSAQALHITPKAGDEGVLGNFCFDTTKYYDEVTLLNKEQGLKAAKRRYWEIMNDPNIPCYSRVELPVILVRMVSETKNLVGRGGLCFRAQVWEAVAALVNPPDRKIYAIWHVKCDPTA